MVLEDSSCLGERDPPAEPVEQSSAQLSLELGYVLRQGRLTEVQRLRSRSEAAGARHREEYLELPKSDLHNSAPYGTDKNMRLELIQGSRYVRTVDVVAHEPAVRITIFVVIFGIIAIYEAVAPRRPRMISRRIRWPNNLAIPVLNTLLVRMLFPAAAVGMSILAEERGWGLFHAIEPLPAWLVITTVVVLLYSPSTSSMCSFMPCRSSGACIGCITPISTST